MKKDCEHLPSDLRDRCARSVNPFSTRFTRPGAIAYRFPDGTGAAQLVDKLASFNWLGQVVGPHGSGKSTLLVALVAEIERRGRRVALFVLHDGQRRLPEEFQTLPSDSGLMVVIDGYEQLGWWSRWRLLRVVRRRGWGLLVTTHRPG